MFRHPCTTATFAVAAGLAFDALADQQRPDGEPCIQQALRLAGILAAESGSEGPMHPALLVAAVLLPAYRLGWLTDDLVQEELGDEAAAFLAEINHFKLLNELEGKEVAQAENLSDLSTSTRIVLLADIVANLRYLSLGPSDGWPEERVFAYHAWATEAADQLRDADDLLWEAAQAEAAAFETTYAANTANSSACGE